MKFAFISCVFILAVCFSTCMLLLFFYSLFGVIDINSTSLYQLKFLDEIEIRRRSMFEP